MRYPSRHQRARHDAVSDWRGLDDGPLNNCPMQTLDMLIPEVLRGWKLDEKLREDDVAAAWMSIVGGAISKLSAPDTLKRGVLTVRVLQPSAHHTLMMMKGLLVKKLQEHFGINNIRDVKFRHG